ncbi:response regulator transcription factor [Actimicrobium antarcticum]|uniref:Response regulator n=1 Tax=Actimicrobium antarcticum TaxID=1051899 RepID=A0ABP7TKS6_9BURK
MSKTLLDPVVYVVDDDPAVRDSLGLLLHSIGLDTLQFSSPIAFLKGFSPDVPGCLLLDIRMPGSGGLAFQEELAGLGFSLPIIFISGHGDLNQCRRAFRAGACDFLTKPIDENVLIESVQKAVLSSVNFLSESGLNQKASEIVALLSPREREILGLMATGVSNKEISYNLHLSLRTIESHRARIFEKFGVRSLAKCLNLYSNSKA